MKKIFIIFVIVVALCGAIFTLADYDIFVQLKKISLLNFLNPLDEFKTSMDSWLTVDPSDSFNFKNIVDYGKLVLSFFQILIGFIDFIFNFIKDIVVNIILGFDCVMILLGFR